MLPFSDKSTSFTLPNSVVFGHSSLALASTIFIRVSMCACMALIRSFISFLLPSSLRLAWLFLPQSLFPRVALSAAISSSLFLRSSIRTFSASCSSSDMVSFDWYNLRERVLIYWHEDLATATIGPIPPMTPNVIGFWPS